MNLKTYTQECQYCDDEIMRGIVQLRLKKPICDQCRKYSYTYRKKLQLLKKQHHDQP